jgi:protein involved in polysaccharide export with SLBB domain
MRFKAAISALAYVVVAGVLAVGVAGGQTTPTPDYVLHSGDDLSIKVFHLPELDQAVRIRPDGKISLQLLNDVQAEGVTPTALAQKLMERYGELFKEPKVAVIVTSFAEQKVFIGGEVGQPAVLPLVGNMTAITAVIQAGGFRPSARKNQVIIIRNDGKGGVTVQTLDLNNPRQAAAGNTRLQPFDVVYVPQSRISKVDQFVEQYVRQVLPGTLTGGFSYLLGNRATVITPTVP